MDKKEYPERLWYYYWKGEQTIFTKPFVNGVEYIRADSLGEEVKEIDDIAEVCVKLNISQHQAHGLLEHFKIIKKEK